MQIKNLVATGAAFSVFGVGVAFSMTHTISNVVNGTTDANGNGIDVYGIIVGLDSGNVSSPVTPNGLRLQIKTPYIGLVLDSVSTNVIDDTINYPHPIHTVVEAQFISTTGVVHFGDTVQIGWSQTELKPTDGTCAQPGNGLSADSVCSYGKLYKPLPMFWTDRNGTKLPKGTLSVVLASTGTYYHTVGARSAAIAASSAGDVSIPANGTGVATLPTTTLVNPGESVVMKYIILDPNDVPIATVVSEDEPFQGTDASNVTFTLSGLAASVKVRDAAFKVVSQPIAVDQLVVTNPALSSMTPMSIVPVPPPGPSTARVPALSPIAAAILMAILLAAGVLLSSRSKRRRIDG